MKKQIIAILSALLISGSAFALCSCSGGNNEGGTPPPQSETQQPAEPAKPEPTEPTKPEPEKPSLKKFEGLKLEDATATYDGNAHPLSIEGTLPSGASVKYSDDNDSKDAGEYSVTATVSGEGYEDLKLTAKLTINKATITGLTFEGGTFTYDGTQRSVALEGELPEGSKVTYSCKEDSTITDSATDAGVYTITATVAHKNYQYSGEATLTINKATITGLKFASETYSYDNAAHSVEIVGVLPEGSKVTYSCKENPAVTNSAKETGVYTITATVTNKNYEAYTAQATLTIKGEEKERFIYSHGGKLYFGNALDNDKLYSYTSAEGVKKVSGDVPRNFTVMGGDLYFRSYSPFGSSVKTVGETGVSTVITAKGEYLCTDGSYLYFAQNSFTQEKSGIYKVNLSGSEPTATLLSSGKAKYLNCYGGYIYFADGANGNKLSRISVSGGARTLVVDEKITCLEKYGSALYYTVDDLLGNYIERYDLSTQTSRKLTSDAGANLTVIGSKLYYVNVDILNSYLYGKGIYSVDANPSADNGKSGTKLLGDDTEVYGSLTAVDGKLAYYRASDQMLCVSDTDGANTLEALAGFVPPETVPLSTGSKTLAYGKSIYFMDLHNDKALYSYDTTTKNLVRITSNKVSDFAILGDTLYYNAVSFGVNNDLYKVDLKLGGEPERVSENDCNDIVTDGEKVFYIKENAAGAATAITEISADGTEKDIFTKGVSNLIYYESYLYFEYDNKVHRMPVNGYTVDVTENVTHKDVSRVGTFVIDDGVIYFRELYGIGWGFKRLSRMNIDGADYAIMISDNTDPLEIRVADGKVYYYNDVLKGASGIYCIDKNATGAKSATLVLDYQQKYYASQFTVLDGNIYFINFRAQLGDSHFYCYNAASKKIEKVV